MAKRFCANGALDAPVPVLYAAAAAEWGPDVAVAASQGIWAVAKVAVPGK